MSRSLVIIPLLTLLLFDFHVGTVDSSTCRDFSDFVSSIFSFNRKVNFYVYKNSYAGPQQFSCQGYCDLRNLQFNPNIRTTVVIHGFLSDYKTDWIQSLIHHLFMWQEMNIIVVDWSDMFNVNYYQTAKRVGNVAHQLNNLLRQIAKKVNRNLRDWPYLHIIGHSLGAHVAGEAALLLRNNVFVHRVTAFDPAKPYFDGEGAHMKLKKWSAQFIDVIHTNCAQRQDTFGLFEPLGHMDFYPNGGDNQPKCNSEGVSTRFFSPTCLSEFIFGDNLIALKRNYLRRKFRGNDMVCDHGEASKYFIDTIIGRSTFIAKKVNDISQNSNTGCADENCIGRDCVTMGINSVRFNYPWYHGVYYVNTKCIYRYFGR